MNSIDPKLMETYNQCFNKTKTHKTELSKALLNGKKADAEKILESKKDAQFSTQEVWQIKVLKNLDFNDQEFLSLSTETQNLIYRTANNLGNIPFVAHLNSLRKFTRDVPPTSPSILTQYMDIATINQTIKDYLIKLRKENRLLTKRELILSDFYDVSIKKGSKISRILGCDHLVQQFKQCNTKHMKVPEKKVVVEKSTLSFGVGGCSNDELMDIWCDDISIFAEEIEPVERFLTREEIIELFTIIEASNFSDLWDVNFIVAADGVYFIDTELKSFNGNIMWGKMGRLRCFVSPEDQELFNTLLVQKIENAKQKKVKRPLPIGHVLSGLRSCKEYVKEHPEETLDADFISSAITYKRVVEQCKLVGSHNPWREEIFSIPLQEIDSQLKS